MRVRGRFSMAISAVLLVLIIASYVSPSVRDRLIGFTIDCIDALRQFRDFVLELLGH